MMAFEFDLIFICSFVKASSLFLFFHLILAIYIINIIENMTYIVVIVNNKFSFACVDIIYSIYQLINYYYFFCLFINIKCHIKSIYLI